MTLHPDQEDALARVEQAYKEGARAPILVAATAFGKTHTAAVSIDRHRHAGRTTWFLAHLGELLDDSARRLQALGVPYGWIRSGHPMDLGAPCQLVSLQTAARRLDELHHLPRPDQVDIDECDLAVAPSYQTILDALDRPKVLGLTGTPIRLDGKPMSAGGFDRLILTADTVDLVDQGRLSRLRMWTFIPPLTLRRVPRHGRELDAVAAGRAMASRFVLADALGHWRRHAIEPDGRIRPTAVFCHSVESAEATAREWQQAGLRAMAVHGQSSKDDRRKALAGLREGRLDAVMSADLWIAGVDVDRIACILCLRHTESLRIWLQMVGRGLRLCDEWPDCKLLDLVGNATRLGSPLQRRMATWSLDALPTGVRGGAAPSLQPVPVCQQCRSCDVVGRICRECGHEQELRLPHGPTVVTGELLELDPRAALRRQREEEKVARQEQARRVMAELRRLGRRAREEGWPQKRLVEELTALGTTAGYNNPRGWAHVQLGIRSGGPRASRARRVG